MADRNLDSNLDRNIDFTDQDRPQNRLTVSHNLVETFVIAEVERQFASLPDKTKQFMNKSDVIAYALNRLPALYATTQDGLRRQQKRLDIEIAEKAKNVIRQGLMAVKLDPFRFSEPIESRQEESPEWVLQELKGILKSPTLSWNNLAEVVRTKLVRTKIHQTSQSENSSNHRAHFDWTPVVHRIPDSDSFGE